VLRWGDGNFPVMREIRAAEFSAPRSSISLQDHDFVGIAKTGSGKTLAYNLHLHSILHRNHQSLLSANQHHPSGLQIVDVWEDWQKEQKLCRLMRKDGWPAMCIHGDKQQKERDWVLGEFKSGSTSILVATDVAARGLDVDDVKFVINYDYPNNSEDYIHRIIVIMLRHSSCSHTDILLEILPLRKESDHNNI